LCGRIGDKAAVGVPYHQLGLVSVCSKLLHTVSVVTEYGTLYF
jgi:hypothetical protein